MQWMKLGAIDGFSGRNCDRAHNPMKSNDISDLRALWSHVIPLCVRTVVHDSIVIGRSRSTPGGLRGDRLRGVPRLRCLGWV